MTLLESTAMRLYQQIRASIARSSVVGAGLLVFVSGLPLSASGQTAPVLTPSQAAQSRPLARRPHRRWVPTTDRLLCSFE